MAKLKEIEVKWNAEKIARGEFNANLTKFLKSKKLKYEIKRAEGFDYYYSSKSSDVVRHRVSVDTNEITIKARLSKKSTKIRIEKDLELSKKSSVVDVIEFLGLLGIKKEFQIYKDCDIYFIQDGRAEISIVWYKVNKPNGSPIKKDRIFTEVEIHNVGERESVKALAKWIKVINGMFGLTNNDLINESLYEIYSGKRYKLMKEKK